MHTQEVGMSKTKKRLNITIPMDFYKILKEYTIQKDLNISETIRMAVREWLDMRIKEEMAEGYKAWAEEGLKILEDFKNVDREVW
jgi:hypothetical protein